MTTVDYSGRNIKWNSAEDANSLISSLNEAKDLQCLKLEANTLGVEAAEVIGNALAKHAKFERALWNDLFTGRMKTEIPQALKHLFSGIMRAKAKLIELDLSDNALGPIGVEGITEFIKSPSCYSLQVLRLNNNGLGIKGGTMLAKSLIELTENASKAGTPLKLKVLISGRNRLENEGAKIFAKFFSQVKSLEEIAMPQNGIFHPGITALVKSFSLNPNLRSINLNDNTFTPVGAKSLALELPNMPNLEIINFGDCLFKTAGAISMARAISSNHMKLKEIYLDSNEIQTPGGIAVIEAIADKPAISHLMLDTNQFGSDGAEMLMEMLRKMGKEDIMGSLEENEDPDEDEEEDEEGSDDDEDESVEEETEEEEDDDEEEEEVDDEEECTGVSPMMRAATLQPVQCSASEFMAGPSVGRFLGLADSIPGSLLQEAKERAKEEGEGEEGAPEDLIFEYVRAFMTVSSFSTSQDKKVLDLVEISTRELAREAFTVADRNGLVSVATNAILVHFGLVKSENKKFKIEWDLKGGSLALAKVVPEPFFPPSTKDTLQFFFSKHGLQIDDNSQEKQTLLSSLSKAA